MSSEDKTKLPVRWLTTAEAARYLGCSAIFLHKDRQTRLHQIPFSRLGRAVRYDVHALDAYLESTRSAAI